jgi:hypothetical protein
MQMTDKNFDNIKLGNTLVDRYKQDIQLAQFKVNCCRVCGFNYKDIIDDPSDLPWHADGRSPTFEICICCGCEWGYHDYKNELILAYREQWEKENKKFSEPEFCPVNWDVNKQLALIPYEFSNEYLALNLFRNYLKEP